MNFTNSPLFFSENISQKFDQLPPIVTNIIYLMISLAVVGGIVTFIIIDSDGEYERLWSALGIIAFVFIGFLISANPEKIRWRHVLWGLGIEFVFGLLVLRWEVGRNIFQCIGDKVGYFLAYTDSGSGFVYGYLVYGINSATLNSTNVDPEEFENIVFILNQIFGGGVFMFKVLSVIFFFSFFTSMLFYWGVLQWVVMKLGWLLSISVGTTAAESLNAAANVFLGQTEAPLLIRPFLPNMTK